MTDSERALVALSAALAGRDDVRLDSALRTAGDVCESEAVEEALVQSYLFLGYPTALNALALWRRISGRPAGPAAGPVDRAERGASVCRAVYGGQYGRLRENIRRLHPDMEVWMVEEGYGKVLGRPGLDLVTRELCIVAILAVQDAPRQLYSHMRGALNVGADPGDVAAALAVAAPFGGDLARARAAEAWAELLARRGTEVDDETNPHDRDAGD